MRRSVAIPARSTLPASDRLFAAPETPNGPQATNGWPRAFRLIRRNLPTFETPNILGLAPLRVLTDWQRNVIPSVRWDGSPPEQPIPPPENRLSLQSPDNERAEV